MSVIDVFSKAVEADEAAGSLLIDAVVYDFLNDLAEVNKSDIQGLLGVWALDRVQIAKKALARSYVDTVSKGAYPNDDVQRSAEWLAGIERFVAEASVSKANEWWSIGNKRTQRNVSRDAQGRFTRGVNQNATRSISPGDDNDPAKRMSPALRGWSNGAGWKDGMTAERAAGHQGQYYEAHGHAMELKNAIGNAKNADLVMMLQNPNGDIRMVHVPMDKVNGQGIDVKDLNADDRILGVEVAPGRGASAQDAARIAEFNMLGGAGGSALAQLANTKPELRAALAQSLKMPSAAQDKSGLSRVFDVFSAGGAVLGGVSGAEKVSQMAALVGVMGPQAEQVLGPYVKRSAYRYRGTEKTPDQGLRDPQATLTADQAAKVKQAFPESSSESLVMHARADAASAQLAETIPQDPIIARLSEASGQVLPSQGVIYDANGKLVSQSVGFTDDHYLPFDLMNVGRLRGGQYVRTRQQGGLTGEDVYTAVMSGARQVQVVSGSGVFSLEMAPDFRGARAMSDKARGMYDNYLKILDAVQASGLYLEDIPASEKSAIYADVESTLGPDAERKDIRALAERKIEQARRASQTVSEADELLVSANALAEAGGSVRDGESPADAAARLRGRDRRVYDDAYEEGMADVRATKANKLSLNAEGYSVALQTLKQQFPYFIADARYRQLNALPTDKVQNLPKTRRFAQDSGYAQPGSLRARNVQTGFYNPGDIEPGAKPQGGRSGAAAPVEEVKTQTGTGTATAPTQAVSAAPADKAPSVGAQGRIDSASSVVTQNMSTFAGEVLAGTGSIPRTARMLASPNSKLPFSSVSSDKTEAVKWALSQSEPADVIGVLEGPDAGKLGAALSDRDAVESALAQFISMDDTAVDTDDFFASRKIGGEASFAGAVDWLTGKGAELSDLAALKQGLVKEPSTLEGVIGHRGLMPLQMSGIANLGSLDDLRSFSDNPSNSVVSSAARAISFDGKEPRDIAQMSDFVGSKLDALAGVKAAQEGVRAAARENKDPKRAGDFVTAKVWTDATGTPLPDDLAPLMNLNVDEKSIQLQQAWSLAVTDRILSVLDGGGRGPKALAPLPELLEKSARRPLMGPTGRPLVGI